MFSKLKLYLSGLIAAAFMAITAYAKYQSSQKDKYKTEAESSKAKAESVEKRIEAYEKREEIEQSVSTASSDDIDDRLQQWYRD